MLAPRSWQTWRVNGRRERLQAARLYLVCDQRPDEFLRAVLRGGVDVVQLRVKDASDDETIAAALRFARVCAEHQALFILNDRPDLAAQVGADGVHVGQDDISVARARRIVGPERIVGLSTHTVGQVAAGGRLDLTPAVDAGGPLDITPDVDAGGRLNPTPAVDASPRPHRQPSRAASVDYLGVGPVHATPTKPGRPAVGLELVRYAARRVTIPWFAIGGIDADRLGAVRDAGSRRIAVVRALTEASDPERAARELRAAILSGHEHKAASVGAA